MMQIIEQSFSVIVDGKEVRTYEHEGKKFFCAEPGKKFTVRLRNGSGGRVLSVLAVDGVNVVTGKRASRGDKGYVVSSIPVDIEGWRTSDENVAEFVFSSKEGSYAAKGGKGTDTGVIACAFYAEKTKPISISYVPYVPRPICPCGGWCQGIKDAVSPLRYQPSYTGTPVPRCGGEASMSLDGWVGMSASTPAANSAFHVADKHVRSASLSSVGSLGTAFGDDIESIAITTEFERGAKLREQVLYYDTRENLRAMGVPVGAALEDLPSGFPEDDKKYCQKP